MAIVQEKEYAASPASDRVSRISSGAYATDDSASDANTGRAIRFGSRVSPSWVLRSLRPTSRRLPTSDKVTTFEPIAVPAAGAAPAPGQEAQLRPTGDVDAGVVRSQASGPVVRPDFTSIFGVPGRREDQRVRPGRGRWRPQFRHP